MKLYIFRHALADFSGKSPDPALTSKGRSQVKKVTSLAKNFGFKPGLIISSPLRRAKETAELTRLGLSMKSEVLVNECLYGDRRPDAVYKFLKKTKTNQIVLVSHQPLIDKLMSDLLGKSRIDFINGAIACVDVKTKLGKGHGSLSWLLPPPS